jgi:8-oxo-dGTP pyrophosphatase MutT (NUDIX family)
MIKSPLPRWSVKSSRHIYRDRWISLRADDCITPDGIEVSPYYVLEYPDVVLVLALTNDHEVVLVRQYRHGLRVTTTELPGGIIDEEDCDVMAAAARELAEETGYVCEHLHLVGKLASDAAHRNNRFHIVLGLNARPLLIAKPDASEKLEVELIHYREAAQMCHSGEIEQAQAVAALLLGLKAAEAMGIFPRSST